MRMQKIMKVLSLVVLVMMEVLTPFSYAIASQVLVTFNSNWWSEVECLLVDEGSSISDPETPTRDGYEFKWRAVEVKYKVTYVVNEDKEWKAPEGFEVPTDLHLYSPWEMVEVKPPLTTEVDYAYNSEGEKVKGTWEFETWDKADFDIYEDITVTGGWRFTPAPEKTYTYTVHYKLYEGSIADAEDAVKVHDDTTGTVKALGTTVPIDAIPVKDLKPQFRKKYRIYPGFQHVDVTITHDDYEIIIWYEKIPIARAVNPNSVAASGIKEDVIEEDEKEEVIEEEKAEEIVEVDEKEEIIGEDAKRD